MSDIRDAMRDARDKARQATGEPHGTSEAHWERLHRQIDSLPLLIALAQLLVWFIVAVLVAVYVAFRASHAG